MNVSHILSALLPSMRWDIVTISLGFNVEPSCIDLDSKHYKNISFPDCEEILIVNDASEDVGSGGSALNALIRTAERLCHRQSQSVLTETVLQNSNVLIVLVSDSKAVKNANKNETINAGRGIVFDTYLANSIKNATTIAEKAIQKGVWLIGTDALWKLGKRNSLFDLPQDSITGFTFLADKRTMKNHGWYLANEKNELIGMEFDGEQSGGCWSDSKTGSVILGFLYLPIRTAIAFLSLYSEFPVAATTYLGVDSNVKPLKLSIFFDFLLATCTDETAFIMNKLGSRGKVSGNVEDRSNARRQVFRKLKGFKGRIEVLDIKNYEYKTFPETERNYESLMDKIAKELHSHRYVERAIRSQLSIHKLLKHSSQTSISRILNSFQNQIQHSDSPESHLQTIFLASLALSLASDGKGGLRNGPAKNAIFENLMHGNERHVYLLKMLDEILQNWVAESSHMIRAARHLESAAQRCILGLVDDICLSKSVELTQIDGPTPSTALVTAPVRVDFFGGWLDTPPIFFFMGNAAVINMAIKLDGQNPISCFIRKIDKPIIDLTQDGISIQIKNDKDLFYMHDKPSEIGALVCACIVALGFQTLSSLFKTLKCTGLSIETQSNLPHGSGLGTSSTVACTIIKAICALGCVTEGTYGLIDQIVHTVLRVEQIMTTGGGWQDQCGSMYEGMKKCYYSKQHGIVHKQIPLTSEVSELIEKRLLLVYTGKTRLAKHLLQEVIRSFFTCEETKRKLSKMAEAVDEFSQKIEQGDMPIELLDQYHATKNFMTRCEPPLVKELLEKLKSLKMIKVGWAAGAGGGGFLYLWLTEDTLPLTVENYLKTTPQFANMTCHRISIALESTITLETTMQ